MSCKALIPAILLFSFLANSAAFGLNAKSLIGIDEAGSAQRLEISGIGPENAPSSGGSGGAGDPAYNFAGSKINIGLPTELDDAGYAYLDDLKSAGQLTAEEMKLVQHQFYDQEVALSPAFKVVLSIAIGNFVAPGLVGGILSANAPAWVVSAADTFASNLMMGGIEGVVSGDLNIGKILEGATFSAVTAGLTAGINIDIPQGNAPLIAGFGSTQLTLSGLVNAGLDGVMTSGLSSAVYGTDFGAGVVGAITRAIVTGVAGASIQEASDLLGHDVASLEKTIAKATVNCLAAQANGASCASGALGTLVTEFGLNDPRLLGATSPQDLQNRLELVAAIAGFFASEGQAQNVSATAGAAMLDFENNQAMGNLTAWGMAFQLNELDQRCAAAGGSADSCNALRQSFIDGTLQGRQEVALLLINFIPVVGDIKALAECIQTPTPAICGAAGVSLIPGAGDVAKIVISKGDEVLNLTVAGGKVVGVARGVSASTIPDSWKPITGVGAHLGAVQAAQGGDLDVFVATMVLSSNLDDFANLSPAQTIAMIRVTDAAFASSQSLRDQYTQERYELMVGAQLDGTLGLALQVMDDAAFDALPEADREYLTDRMAQAYFDLFTTVPGGQADGPAFKSTKLREAVKNRLAVGCGVDASNTLPDRIIVRTNAAGHSVLSIQGKEMSFHAYKQATTRGISNESIANAMDQKPFHYTQSGRIQNGYYDATTNVFVGVGDRITTVMRPNNPDNYLNNLRNRQ